MNRMKAVKGAQVVKCPGDEDDISITNGASGSRLNTNMTEFEDDSNGTSGILFSIFLLPLLLVVHQKVYWEIEIYASAFYVETLIHHCCTLLCWQKFVWPCFHFFVSFAKLLCVYLIGNLKSVILYLSLWSCLCVISLFSADTLGHYQTRAAQKPCKNHWEQNSIMIESKPMNLTTKLLRRTIDMLCEIISKQSVRENIP